MAHCETCRCDERRCPVCGGHQRITHLLERDGFGSNFMSVTLHCEKTPSHNVGPGALLDRLEGRKPIKSSGVTYSEL